MTYEEAIQNLINPRLLVEDVANETYNLCYEALCKQIPMKVRITASTKRCGRCNRQLSGIGNIHSTRKFCTGCGQAIDWSEK